MNWPLISGYLIAGVGVAIGVHCMFAHRSDWRGATRVAGVIICTVFWPVPIIALATLALAAAADR